MSSLSTHTPVHPAAGAEITADAEASTAVSSADLSFAEGLRYVTTQDAPVTPWEAGHTPSPVSYTHLTLPTILRV